MMVMVLGVYFLSSTPRIINGLMLNKITDQGSSLMYNMDRLASLIWWLQSFLNLVIYAWQSQEFKRAFRKLLKMKTNHIQPWMP